MLLQSTCVLDLVSQSIRPGLCPWSQAGRSLFLRLLPGHFAAEFLCYMGLMKSVAWLGMMWSAGSTLSSGLAAGASPLASRGYFQAEKPPEANDVSNVAVQEDEGLEGFKPRGRL